MHQHPTQSTLGCLSPPPVHHTSDNHLGILRHLALASLFNLLHIPLSDTTNNSSHVPLNQGSKRPATSQPGSHAKQQRTAAAPAEIETALICGVGPLRLDSDLPAAIPSADTVPVTVPPLQGYKSLATLRAAPSNVATDVWHFMCSLDQKEKPEEWPAKSPDGSELVEKPLNCQPKSAFVGCKLCSK